jgi:trans-2,3-dihydro-3-hydroxyanthranilate isomerase
MKLTFLTFDVFTDTRFGGNPLAVVLDATGLSDAQMLTIAKEFNYSETTFVLPPQNPLHTALVRIFTPGGELPFAGHPTVGTAFALDAAGLIDVAQQQIIFEEGVGAVPVALTREAGHLRRATLTAPRDPQSRVQLLAPSDAAAVLGLPLNAIAGLPIAPFSCGVPFLVLPLASRQALSDCKLDLARWTTHVKGRWADMVYPVFIDVANRVAHVRMFAPGLSVPEDPATGGAAAAFAGYLAAHVETTDGRHSWALLQGQDMGRPSEIALSFDQSNGQASNVQVGGAAIGVLRGELVV